MDVQLKTASFGGYDKKSVESYIEELQEEHEKEVAELKANVLKLSETVKNLHTMREVNLNESSSAIDNLKKVNDDLQNEIIELKSQLDSYKTREEESASRYESISRTLLAARENADLLIAETTRQCNEQKTQVQNECDILAAETAAACDKLRNDTNEECDRLNAETIAACDKLNEETKSSCQELKESTFANCEDLKRRTKEETDSLRAQTQYECNALTEKTTAECEEMKSQARADAYSIRLSVKRECESVSEYMAQLLMSVDNVVKACEDTKAVADQAFPDLNN